MGLYDRPYYSERDSGFSWNPTATWSGVNLMIALCAIAYVLDILTMGASPSFRIVNIFAAYPADLYTPWRWFSFLTYGFVHAPLDQAGSGIFHILMNMLVLWMFGRQVESHLGKTKFLVVYLSSIVICGVLTAAWNLLWSLGGPAVGPDSLALLPDGQSLSADVPAIQRVLPGVIGASGAVTTILIYFCCLAPNARVILFIIPMPAWVLGLIIVAMDFFRALGSVGADGPRIAHETHLIGAALGAIYFYQGLPSVALWDQATFWWKSRRLRVVRAENNRNEKLALQADEILDKVNRSGYDSLTSAEKKTLEKYSRQLRSK